MKKRQHKFTQKKSLTKERGATNMARTKENPLIPQHAASTMCKIGRVGTGVTIVGKNNTPVAWSKESVGLLKKAINDSTTSIKIPVYGLSRAEIGNVIKTIACDSNKTASVYIENSKGNQRYVIFLQEKKD